MEKKPHYPEIVRRPYLRAVLTLEAARNLSGGAGGAKTAPKEKSKCGGGFRSFAFVRVVQGANERILPCPGKAAAGNPFRHRP